MQRIPRHLLAGVIALTAGGGVAAYAVGQLVSSSPAPAAVAAVLPAPTVTVTTTAPPPPPAAKPVLRLRASAVSNHGTVVVDGAGLTLYRSDKDSSAPPASNCADACLQQWKPLLVDDAQLAFEGVASTAAGTITRADGKAQLTLGGWPLYRFVGDTKPGDVAGQCKGGFFAVTPTGGKSM